MIDDAVPTRAHPWSWCAHAALVLILLLWASPARSHQSSDPEWNEDWDRAEHLTAEWLGVYPGVRSDRFDFKAIPLPDDGFLTLDLRIERPSDVQPGDELPVVFFVHGGAWATGSKTQFREQSFDLAERGIAGVRIEYRLIRHGGEFTNVITDVMDSIDFVRQRAHELGIDFTRVGLAGGSAGAHLSSIAAMRTPECICYDGYNGLYDAVDRGNSTFGGGPFTGDTVEEKQNASVIFQIRENPPDTFLYHGTADTTTDIDQSRRFGAAIREAGGLADTIEYEGQPHAFFNSQEYLLITTQALIAHVEFCFGLSDHRPDPRAFLIESVPPGQIQTRQIAFNGSTGAAARGQSFVPAIGLSPFVRLDDDLLLESIEFVSAGGGSTGEAGVYLGVFDGPDIDRSSLLALSAHPIDTGALPPHDEVVRWEFAHDTVPAFAEVFAQLIVIDPSTPSGYRNAGLSVRRQDANPYTGGGLLFGGTGPADTELDARFIASFSAPIIDGSADLDRDGDVDDADTDRFLIEFEAATELQ
ncbi:MAG: alpha/beta hydrolase [Planctomycetota bacterium]